MTVSKYQKTLPITPRSIRMLSSAAGAVANSSEVNLGGTFSSFGFQVRTAGSSDTVLLQGSLSGGSSDWATLLTWAASSDTSSDIKFISSAPVNLIRARISQATTAADLISAWVSASY